LHVETISTDDGKVIVHWTDVDMAELPRFGEVSVALADHPRGQRPLLNVADSLRRIAAAGTGSVRGSVTSDDVLVVSRSADEGDFSRPFLRKDDRIILSKDGTEFAVVQDSVASGRLTVADVPESSAFRMSNATLLETEILEGLMSRDRMLYSVRSVTPAPGRVSQKYVTVRPTLPIGFVAHYQSLPDICMNQGASAGINGGFFANFPEELSLHTVLNDPVGLLVADGHVRFPPSFRRGTFIVSIDGSVHIEVTDLRSFGFQIGGRSFSGAKLRRGPESIPFEVNQASHEGVAVYSSAFGSNSPGGQVVDFVVAGDIVVEVKKGGNAQIPQSGFVLQIADARLADEMLGNLLAAQGANQLEGMLHSDRAKDGIRHAMAAGPVLISNGVNLKPDHFSSDQAVEEFEGGKLAPTRFNTSIDDVRTRTPRSAVGITPESHVLFVTVDDDRRVNTPSEQRRSIGANLSELAGIMKDLGCREALNLDGGGSSTLWMEGEVRNSPSDGFARAIPSALLVVPAAGR
jgi:exopolysaccharide biosynthesis protein